MKFFKIIKPVFYLGILIVIATFYSAKAVETCKEINGVKFLKYTFCPCPPDNDGDPNTDFNPALASVCGLISNANITDSKDKQGQVIYSTREPLGGVTVSIFENSPDYPTGKPWGMLKNRLSDCSTTPKEGKYWCVMRRINPGNYAYVIFSCNGRVADIKGIPSVQSQTSLDVDLNCGANLTYTPLPDSPLPIGDRGTPLGCTVAEEDPQAGFGKEGGKEFVYESANTEEKKAETRFAPFSFSLNIGPITLSASAHPGAIWERDCLVRYTKNDRPEYGISRNYDPTHAIFNYRSIDEKCNFNNAMTPMDQRTTPFRYDIPDKTEEDVFRVWEVRTSLQREVQDLKGIAQYIHLTLGDCIGSVFLRFYKSLETQEPLPCSELSRCTQSSGEPYKNIHTSFSFASRLADNLDWEEVRKSEERDRTQVICHDEKLGDVTIGQIQPYIPEDNCVPGAPGCQYKLPKTYYLPQFLLMVGSVTKPRISEAVNDSFVSAPRDVIFNPQLAAETPHEGGHHIVYPDEGLYHNNSGVTALRVVDDTMTAEPPYVGILANRFVSYIDALDKKYDYSYDTTVSDFSGNMQSLCSVSSVNDGPGSRKVPIITILNEAKMLLDNDFIGNAEDHKKSKTAAAGTYGVTEAITRDEELRLSNPGGGESITGADMLFRDLWDTFHRFSSGGGVLEMAQQWFDLFLSIFKRTDANLSKSFSERVPTFGAANPVYFKETHCISEENFKTIFPPYGNSGYPGDMPGCYTWSPVGNGGQCLVWPGREESWPPTPNVGVIDPKYSAGWPNVVDEIRTCRVDQCHKMWKARECDEYIEVCTDPINHTGCNEECGDLNLDGDIDTKVVNKDANCDLGSASQVTPDKTHCLQEQLSNWNDWEDCPASGFPTSSCPMPIVRHWEKVEEPGPNVGDTGAVLYACALSRAGPYLQNDDFFKDHSARLNQAPFDGGTQRDVAPVSESANYTALAWLSEAEPRQNAYKGLIVDYAVTNDQQQTIEAGGAHEYTAGANSEGFGTGATVNLLKVVSHPERASIFTEAYPAVKMDYCDMFDPNQWCFLIKPPPPIDIDALDGGSCTPHTTNADCPVKLPEIAEKILGAAGRHSGVSGATLIAIMWGEGGWITSSTPFSTGRMGEWTDANVRKWSEPWYARMPSCNDMVWSAQGPFGLITPWFNKGVITKRLGDNGGFYPTRMTNYTLDIDINGDGSIESNVPFPVVSKCNFLDAAYAAARMVNSSGTNFCNQGATPMLIDLLTTYRGGTPPSADMITIINSCN